MFEISKSDEKKLDLYEDFPILYKKHYFIIMEKNYDYTMVKKTLFKFPTERYLNIVKRGYKDCNLDTKYLIKALKLNKLIKLNNKSKKLLLLQRNELLTDRQKWLRRKFGRYMFTNFL